MGELYIKTPLLKGFTEEYFVTKDNCRLRYLHKGEGIPLIFIPCFDSMADCFALNGPAFVNDYSVYLMDMRGHGYSDATPQGAHVFRLSADLHEFIEFLGVPKVNLISWSMGCSVVWGYIELFGQDKINKLVQIEQVPLLTADPYASTEEMRRLSANHADLWHIYHAYKKDFDLGWKVASTYLDRPSLEFTEEVMAEIPDDFAEKFSQIHWLEVDEEHRRFLAELARDHWWMDWRKIIPKIECPVLYFTGDYSDCITAETGKWFAETMKNCRWIRLKKEDFAAHNLCQTAYKKFNEETRNFLIQE